MTKNLILFITTLVCSISLSCKLAAQSPPFGGTIFLDPDIITSEAPTTFLGLEETGSSISLCLTKISTLQKLIVL